MCSSDLCCCVQLVLALGVGTRCPRCCAAVGVGAGTGVGVGGFKEEAKGSGKDQTTHLAEFQTPFKSH